MTKYKGGLIINHLRLLEIPAKSNACAVMRNRDNPFFEDIYFILYNIKMIFLGQPNFGAWLNGDIIDRFRVY